MADIEALLSITIDGTTTPTSGTVSAWIDEIEDGMKQRNLGSATTLSGTKIDVVPTASVLAKNTIGWFHAGLPETQVGRMVVFPFTPIISITSGMMQRNKNPLSSAESWETLTEGPGASSDFIILKKVNRRTKKEVGYATFHYQKIPTAGRQRLRGLWTYGHDVATNVLKEYAYLKASEKVLLSRVMSAQPANVATYTAGSDFSTYVNTQYEAQLQYVKDRAEEIEKTYFPKDLPIGIIQAY